MRSFFRAVLQVVWVVVVLFGCVSPETVQAQDGGTVIINEIHYAPTNSRAEFIELYNASTAPVDLARLTYADGNLDFDPVATVPTVLQPGDYAVIVRDRDAFSEAFPGIEAIEAPGWEGLNNGGDLVEVRDGEVVVDRVEYDGDWSSLPGASLERIDPLGPSDASNFAASTATATPGRRNSVYAVDASPPVLLTVRVDRDGRTLMAAFDEAIDGERRVPDANILGPNDPPTASVTMVGPDRIRVSLEPALATGRYTLRVSGIADRRGNAGTTERAFAFVRASLPGPRALVINEIHARAGDVPEFVEIYNRSGDVVDLRDLALSDASSDPVPLSTEPRALPSGEYAVVSGADVTGEDGVRVVLDRWAALNNGGDTVTLWSTDGSRRSDASLADASLADASLADASLADASLGPLTIVDRVDYTADWGGDRDVSIERIDPDGPSEAFNFASSSAGVTPGLRNSRYAPDRTGPRPIFAEERSKALEAGTDDPEAAVDILFDEILDPSSIQAATFTVDGYSVASTRLLADERTVHLELSGTLESGSSTIRVRVEGVRDRTGNTGDWTEVPIARRPRPGDLVINEILFEPIASDRDGRPDQPEYVEFVNRSSRYVSLSDLYVTRSPDENGRVDTVATTSSASGLPPSDYGVFYAGKGFEAGDTEPGRVQSEATAGLRTTPFTIAQAFPGSATAKAAWVHVPATSLRLPNAGGRIRLHAGQVLLDSVAFGPAQHAADLSATRGIALERISTSAPSHDPVVWTSSADPDGGTPGRDNAVFLPERAPRAQVHVAPSPFSIERDGATRIQYALDRAAASLRVEIYDAHGRHVRTLTSGLRTGPEGEMLWDGRHDDGRRARIGIYVVWLEAVDADGRHVAVRKVPVVVARSL